LTDIIFKLIKKLRMGMNRLKNSEIDTYHMHISQETTCQIIHESSVKIRICKASVPSSHGLTNFDSTMPVKSFLAFHGTMVETIHLTSHLTNKCVLIYVLSMLSATHELYCLTTQCTQSLLLVQTTSWVHMVKISTPDKRRVIKLN
jgi:hypothetical protein